MTIVTTKQIADLCAKHGIRERALNLLDSQYACPSRKWIEGGFADWFTATLQAMRFNYAPMSSDCDDFADLARVFAQWCNSRTTDDEVALAFGVFGYFSETIGGHCINVAIIGGKELAFYEPQPQFKALRFREIAMQPVTLTPEEIASCCYMRL